MGKINLLDCTLRDGGYINNWEFGNRTIRSIIAKITDSNVDYVECGYLSEVKGGNENSTQFRTLDSWRSVLPPNARSGKYAVMIDFGKYAIENIPDAEGLVPVIRVCFHKKDLDGALDYCQELMEKGYEVFVQPMTALNYTDEEYLDLIQKVNRFMPACFYIVDSFGAMEIYDFQRLLSLTDSNLNKGIMLGYHAHNNLQQAYGNAKYMAEQSLLHDIVIDASVYGMGRGAGNLNLELFAAYINREYGQKYTINPMLEIMDEHLNSIFARHFWGYSLPFYLSAQYNCHPNYAAYFSEKNMLTQKSMKELFAMLPDDVKNEYSEENAEKYYQEYQKKYVDDKEAVSTLRKKLENRNILILAPGRSIQRERKKILKYIEAYDPVVIGINAVFADYTYDFLFCANEKRYKENAAQGHDCRMIITSNIPASIVTDNTPEGEEVYRINYASYLADDSFIADNPGIMLINLLAGCNVKKISVAGMDGYSTTPEENYFDPSMSMGSAIETKMKKNLHISAELQKRMSHTDIEFLTESIYLAKK